MRIATAVFGSCLLALVSQPLYAYDPITHSYLSQIAADRSNLSGTVSPVLQEIGAASYSSRVYVRSDGLSNQNISDLIAYGSIAEDELPKWLAHFFDPQYNDFQGAPLLVGEETFGTPLLIGQNTSPDWAIEDNGQRTVSISGFASRTQQFSYSEARRYFRLALTASSASTRSANMGLMFEALGHVIHHIQDMAQPQHTRNDPHIPPGLLGAVSTFLTVQPPQAPVYEYFTLTEYPTRSELEAYLASSRAAPFGMNSPTLPTIRHFWHSPGATTANYVGMAEFSSQNFVSSGSLWRPPSWPLLSGTPSSPSQLYVPLPDGTNTSVVPRTVNVTYEDGTSINGTIDFIVGSVRDDYTGVSYQRELAVTSLLTRPSQIYTSERVISINRVIYKGMHDVLLPRAVAFSAGVLDHFFRGRLDVQRASGQRNIWEVTNVSSETMGGTFSIYFENSAGQRNFYGASPATLLPGQSVNVTTPEPPASSTNRVVATFEGSLGLEQNFSGGIAAAKVEAFSPPPVPCGNPLTADGSSEGLVATYELGTVAGTVPVEFEAYNIPDGLTITADNGFGTVLVDSGGLVSGRYNYTFDYSYQSLGTDRVNVTVTGNTNPNTLWWLVVGCPGGDSIDPGDRPQPIRSVRWNFAKDGPSGVSCSFDFYVDGQYVRRVNGNASFFQQLSVGRHQLDYVNKSCTAGNSAAYTATFTDPTGTYGVKSPVFGNTWIFNVQ